MGRVPTVVLCQIVQYPTLDIHGTAEVFIDSDLLAFKSAMLCLNPIQDELRFRNASVHFADDDSKTDSFHETFCGTSRLFLEYCCDLPD
jgi:hypothetical protein